MEKQTSVVSFKSQSANGHTYRQWLIALLANINLLTYGLQTGWISPMTKVLQSDLSPTGTPLTDNELSLIASIFCLTAIAGVFFYTYLADTYGRKQSVALITVPHALSWLLKLSSANTATIIAARVCCGIAAGGCFNVVPIYVKEISQDNVRGLTGSLPVLAQNLGCFLMYAVGAYFEYFTVLRIVTWIPIVTCAMMMFAPESPSYLVKVGRFEEAAASLAWLRGLSMDDKIVISEINNLKNEKLFFESLPKVSVISIYKNKVWRRGFLIMLAIMLICFTNGTFAICTYATVILGTSGGSAELQTLSFPAVCIVAGLLSMACIERFGRKPLLCITMFLIAASMAGLGGALHLQHQGYIIPKWMLTVLMMMAAGSNAAGTGPVPLIMMSEMFNFQIRATLLGIIISCSWLMNFLQLLFYAPISNVIGAHMTFYGFGIINCVGFLVCLVLAPETKGKSVEEIEDELLQRTK